jgi:glycosyltransferase involved in cell wall biosynthesis
MFIDGLAMGGKERRLVELLKGFSQNPDITCTLIVMNPEIHYNEIYDLNIPIHFLIRKVRKDPSIFLKFLGLCLKIKPDVIHVWDSMTAIYASPIAHSLGIKLINAMITEAPAYLDSKTLKRTKVSTFFSDVMLSNSLAGLNAYHVSGKKGRCIHNGFAVTRLNSIENAKVIHQKFEITESKIVGMVSALQERKDYHTFIEAAKIILTNRNDVCFIIVGDGPMRQSLEEMVTDKYKSRIRFLGEQNDVESLINIFDIGVLTTNQQIHGEGISNAILEYMALGKPVIATNGGGTPEIVDDGSTGFLVREKSPEDLAEKILYILNDTELGLKMGEAGRKRILAEFSINDMVNKTLELYKEVLN